MEGSIGFRENKGDEFEGGVEGSRQGVRRGASCS